MVRDEEAAPCRPDAAEPARRARSASLPWSLSMPVLLSEAAAREIASIIDAQGLDAEKIRLRVGVKGGGCAGFSYILDLTESQKETDEEWAYTFPIAAGTGAKTGPKVTTLAGGVATAEGAGSDVATAEGNGAGSFTVKVICDPKSYLYLGGTTIDFRDELMGRGFVFNNPNATSTCGCGSSFGA
jgi:iron-sulfur cluster assembly protein